MLKNVSRFALLALAMLLFAMMFRSPWNEADFQTQYQQLPGASLEGGIVKVNKLRDFRYKADGSISQANYRQAEFNLNLLKNTWYGISHFAPMGIAHVFLSFEFSDGQYLVVSAEARLQNNERYQPIKGLFRAYTKTIVLASEQDVIGLRSHIRQHETLYLYPLKMDQLEQQALLLGFLRAANALLTKPVFYNTIFDNCMLSLLAESYHFRSLLNAFDYRVLLPGFSDKLALEKGLLAYEGDLAGLRQKAWVSSRGFWIDDPDYSVKIRKQWQAN